ncbi:MAG: 50S ribosomal protein L5 [Alphaproteobacteria bacterium]|nr:MAG: 50S ribosomal protein L5 [Alphaproteobacteria bacterium]
MTSRLGNLFHQQIVPNLKKDLNLTNDFSVPRLLKVVISAGCGRFIKDSAKVEFIYDQIMKITGQLPVKAKAKKSVAGFAVREGMISGILVTLRKDKMYNFIDRLVYLTLPKVRDFRGIAVDAFDGNGNYNLGIKDHSVFFESSDDFSFGMNIAFVTSAKTDQQCKSLLLGLNFPFRERAKHV